MNSNAHTINSKYYPQKSTTASVSLCDQENTYIEENRKKIKCTKTNDSTVYSLQFLKVGCNTIIPLQLRFCVDSLWLYTCTGGWVKHVLYLCVAVIVKGLHRFSEETNHNVSQTV